MKKVDLLTGDLFAVPEPVKPSAGVLACRVQIAGVNIFETMGEVNASPVKSAALKIEQTDQQVERLATAIEEISKPIAVSEEAEIETGLPFRCAYTSDGCLMFYLEGEVEPIELNPTDTMTVIEFISDRIMPIAVEIV